MWQLNVFFNGYIIFKVSTKWLSYFPIVEYLECFCFVIIINSVFCTGFWNGAILDLISLKSQNNEGLVSNGAKGFGRLGEEQLILRKSCCELWHFPTPHGEGKSVFTLAHEKGSKSLLQNSWALGSSGLAWCRHEKSKVLWAGKEKSLHLLGEECVRIIWDRSLKAETARCLRS